MQFSLASLLGATQHKTFITLFVTHAEEKHLSLMESLKFKFDQVGAIKIKNN